MRDTTMEDPREVEASKYSLNYIALDGNIVCLGVFCAVIFFFFVIFFSKRRRVGYGYDGYY